MKLSKKEAKGEVGTVESEYPEYPYGLSLHLDDEILSKFGVKELPAVGTTFTIAAKANVTDANEHSSQGDKKKRRSITLQITDMGLSTKDEEKDMAKSLYG